MYVVFVDWMICNFYCRVEVVFFINDEDFFIEICEIIDL